MTDRIPLPLIPGDLSPMTGDSGERSVIVVAADRTLSNLFGVLEVAPSGGTVVVEYRDAASGGGSLLATLTIADGSETGTFSGSVAVSSGTEIFQRLVSQTNPALGFSGVLDFDYPATLTTLDRVKRDLRQNSTDHDPLLLDIIASVSSEMTNVAKRPLLPTAVDEYVDATGADNALQANSWPIIGTPTVLDPNGDAVAGVAVSPEGHVIYQSDRTLLWPAGEYHLTYTAGFSTVPSDLIRAATSQVSFEFSKTQASGQGTLGLQSKAADAGGATSYISDQLLPETLGVVREYRRLS